MKEEATYNLAPHINPTDKISLGMPLEVEGFDNPLYKVWRVGTNLLWSRSARVVVEGDLPYEGPGLFIATHTKTESTAILPWLTTHLVNRPIQPVAKDTLLYPELTESQEVQERTGKKDDGKVSLKDKFFSLSARASNSLPVDRGGINKELFKNIGEVFDRNHLVGWFLQETRSEEDDLTHPMDGAALLSRMYPDVPVWLVAMTNTKLHGSKNRPAFTPTIRVRSMGSYHELADGLPIKREGLTQIYTANIGEMLLEDVPQVRLPDGLVMHKRGGEVIVDFSDKNQCTE